MFTYGSVRTIRDNADKITESAKWENKCLCSKTTTILSEWTAPKKYGSESLTFLFHCK